MRDLAWLLDEHCSITRFSDEDGEYLATYTEPELGGLSGLGATPHDALCELKTAYNIWRTAIIEKTWTPSE